MRVSPEKIVMVMRHRNQKSLAAALSRCRLELLERNAGYAVVRIDAPLDAYEVLRTSHSEESTLQDTFAELYTDCGEITGISINLETGNTNDHLISLVEEQKKLMEAVATGGPSIKSVNDEYKERRADVAKMLKTVGIRDPNPFKDLWAWYQRWSSGDLPTYKSRRQFLSELYDPLLERLKGNNSTQDDPLFDEPTGWPKVDRTVTEIRERLEQASTEEQFQVVGTLCREALISLAQAVFCPEHHPILDDVDVSPTDFKRMIEAYIAVELAGHVNERSRKHATAAFDLANELQHKRTATFKLAALCAEATRSVINLVAIVSGRREP